VARAEEGFTQVGAIKSGRRRKAGIFSSSHPRPRTTRESSDDDEDEDEDGSWTPAAVLDPDMANGCRFSLEFGYETLFLPGLMACWPRLPPRWPMGRMISMCAMRSYISHPCEGDS